MRHEILSDCVIKYMKNKFKKKKIYEKYITEILNQNQLYK